MLFASIHSRKTASDTRNVQPASVLQRQESVSRRLLKADHQTPITAGQEDIMMD
jgi:hypothetical protein